jgi:hypothetical protein
MAKAKAAKAANPEDENFPGDAGGSDEDEAEAGPLLPTHMHHATEKSVIAHDLEQYEAFRAEGYHEHIAEVAESPKHAAEIHKRNQASQSERGNSVRGQHAAD